jgi:4-hydroxybenzoate polyprenyltransferase
VDAQTGPGTIEVTHAGRSGPAMRPLEAAARFVRLFSLGATLLYLLVGVATGAGRPNVAEVGWALVAGLLFHGYADVGNDVMDLPIDRTDPRRATSPLVRGEVTPQTALAVALAMIPLLLATVAIPVARPALGAVVAAVVLIGLYDIAGKSIPIPVVADVVQGAGWAALVVAGAVAGGGVTTATMGAAGAVVVYIVMVNGLHGAIRDAANDRRAGARTTALLLGADVVDGEMIVLPRGVVVWGAVLQAGYGTALIGVLAASGVPASDPGVLAGGLITAGLVAAGLYGASTVAFVGAYRDRHRLRKAMAAGTWHLFLLPASLLAASAAMMPWWMVIVAIAAFLLPPLVYGRAVRDREFDVPATTLPRSSSTRSPLHPRLAGLWEMTRPGTPLAAAVLVGVGGLVSGEPTLRLVPLTTATMLVVAAANVYNDRCDVVADRINRPDRPLIVGPTTGNDADKFVLAASVGAVVLASTIGVATAIATGALLATGVAYSLVLRRIAFVGQAIVAVLFAVPLLYGAAFGAGGITGRTWIAFGLTAAYVAGREVLKGIPDRPGDLAAGYRTPATVLGPGGALRLYRAAAVAFCVASPAVTVVVGDAVYLIAALAGAAGPTVRTLLIVRDGPTPAAIDRAIAFSGLVFASGVIPLLALARGA